MTTEEGDAYESQGTFLLPASPNWYCSKISDCNKEGIYAFGTKDNLTLWNIYSRTCIGHVGSHSNRVTCLEFLKGESNYLIATGSSDKLVCIWDYRTKSLFKHHNEHKVDYLSFILFFRLELKFNN